MVSTQPGQSQKLGNFIWVFHMCGKSPNTFSVAFPGIFSGGIGGPTAGILNMPPMWDAAKTTFGLTHYPIT